MFIDQLNTILCNIAVIHYFLELIMKKLNTHICCLYENLKHLIQNNSWLTLAPTHFVIYHLKVYSVKEQSNVVGNLLRENISNHSQGFKTDNIKDIFKGTNCGITKGKVILMEGAQGIGKTILCKEIAYRWACKELLQGDRIVLLVFLRDPTTQNIKSVESLFHYMYKFRFDDEVIRISKACAEYLMSTAGVNVTIILDGFHELSHLNEFIVNLLCKNILPLCRVVVSSRPVASKVLQQIADVEVEILGFTEEDRQKFINNELKDNSDKLVRLNSYLKENSIIGHLCYNSFMLSVLICIAKEYDQLPKTQTDLHSKFIVYNISQFLQKLTFLEHPMSDLDELPLQFEGYFLEICKYAYYALLCDKIIFTASEIKTDFPTFADAPGSWSGLGLLKAASFEENNECTSYDFLHLSIQEYLAAYHITTLNTNQQINILRNYFFVAKYLNMWIMYIGLSKRPLALMQFLSGKNTVTFTFSRWFSVDKISEDIMQSKIKCLYLFQCLSEIKDSRLYDLVSVLFEKGILDLSNCTMPAKDISTLTYILERSATNQWNELNLSHCHIGDSGCHQLCKALVDRNDMLFNKINLSDNQLSTDSLEVIANFVVCCKTQVLYLSDNFDINFDAKLTNLAIKYAFKDNVQKYPLTIHVYHRENVVFNKLDKQTIVTHMKSKHRITGVYFINCNVDDAVVTTLTGLITTYNVLTHVCLWNSNSSSSVVQDLFLVIRGINKSLFVYENSSTDLENFAFSFINGKHPLLTFIYFNNVSFILHKVDDIHISFIIFPNTIQKLTEVQISNSKMNNNSISLLSQLLSQCRLRKLVLLNNQSDFELLQQLIASVNPLPSLSEVVIEQNNMTLTDSCTIADELSSSQTHSVMIFHNKMLRGYRCYDEQLNESYTEAVISTLLQLCDKQVHVTVYEKNLLDDDSLIHDAFKSTPIAYVLLSKSILLVENVSNSHVISTVLKSSSIYASHLFKIDFSNCNLRSAESIQLLNVLSHCKFLMKFKSTNNRKSSLSTMLLFNNLMSLSSLREVFIYERNLAINDVYIVKDVLIKKNKNISVFLMTPDILLGYKCRNELFNYAVHLNVMITSVLLVYCTIDHFIFESLRHASCIKKIIINYSKFSEQLPESILSSHDKLEELYLGNNQLQLGATKLATAIKNISLLKVLDIANNNITEAAVDEVAAAIRANKSLEKLWLHGNHLGSSTVMMVNALKEITTLKVLDLNDNKNTRKDFAPTVACVLAKNKFMQKLGLRNNGLNDDGVKIISESLCQHTKLIAMNFQNNNITKESAEVLSSFISSNNELQTLSLGDNQLQVGAIKLAIALKTISSLRILDLQNNNIPEEAADELSAAIGANNSLEELWLGGNHLGSSTVMIINALKEITTLKKFSLGNNGNRNKELAPAIASMITRNKLMEILSLNNSDLNDDGVIKIAESLCKHTIILKVLVLHRNDISDKSAEALSSVISSNNELEELYLGNNQLQLGASKIATGLKTISSLKVLDLENNNIPEEVADELAATIWANNSLEQLWLSDNPLGLSVTSILEACCHSCKVKEFAIRNTNICSAIADDLAFFILCNSSLELLEISDNNLQSSGFSVITQALKTSLSLKYLYAFGISVTFTVSEELSSVIDHTPSLEELSLGNNSLQNGLIQIAESCSRLASLKILELSYNCISPTQVVNFASTVSKCYSLEALSIGGICLSVDENLYLNISRIYDQFVMNARNPVNKRESFYKNSFYTLSELLRITVFQVLTSSFNYQNFYMMIMYEYDCVYISYQHKNKFSESKVECEIFLQVAKQKLSQIDSKAMITLLRVIRTLKVINLENNNIDEDAATELAGHLHCNNILEQLWLRGNELYDKGASVVLQSLHNLSTLLILDLSYNHLSSESADGIAVVVGNNCSLQQLWLDGNELLTRGVVRIASALKKLSSLRILSLCSNGITDDAAEEISNVITNNTLLVDLLLGNNQLESKGVCTIAVAIRKLFDLRKLDLSNNHITPGVTEELAVTLSNCMNLKQLFLNDNMLGTEGTIKIANALKCINTLQVLTLSNNNITESAADVLVDVLRNNISLKILLISGNDLQTGVNLITQTTAKNITRLQLLDVSDNNIREDEKMNIKMIFANYNNFIIIV